MDRARRWEELATTTIRTRDCAVIGTTPSIHVLGDVPTWYSIRFADDLLGAGWAGSIQLRHGARFSDPATQMKTDIDVLLREEIGGEPLTSFSPLTCRCAITNVQLLSHGDLRKIVLAGEGGNVEIQTSLTSDTVRVIEQ